MMSTSSHKRKIHGEAIKVKATRSNPFGLQKNREKSENVNFDDPDSLTFDDSEKLTCDDFEDITCDDIQVKARPTRLNPFGLQKNEKSPKAFMTKLTIGNAQLNEIDRKSKTDKKLNKTASKFNMSSTKNSNKRKNILDNSEVSSTKRQKICKNVTAKANEIECEEIDIKKEKYSEVNDKSKELRNKETIGIKTKNKKYIKNYEKTNKKCINKLLNEKSITENKLKICTKIDKDIKGENNSVKNKRKDNNKSIITCAVKEKLTPSTVAIDEIIEIDETQASVELTLSPFYHIHLFIPLEDTDSYQSKVRKNRKFPLLTSPDKSSKSLRNIRCNETKNTEKKNVENSKIECKSLGNPHNDLSKLKKGDKKSSKAKVSKSESTTSILVEPNVSSSCSSLDSVVKSCMDKTSTTSSCTQPSNMPSSSQTMNMITESEGKNVLKSEHTKSLMQRNKVKTIDDSTKNKNTIIERKSKIIPKNPSQSIASAELEKDGPVSKCVSQIENSKIQNKILANPNINLSKCKRNSLNTSKAKVSKSETTTPLVETTISSNCSSFGNDVISCTDKTSTISSSTQLSNMPSSSQPLNMISDSECEKFLRSENNKSLIQRNTPKTSDDSIISKKTSIENELKISKNPSQPIASAVLEQNLFVSQCVSHSSEASLSTSQSSSTINPIPAAVSSICASPLSSKMCVNQTSHSKKTDSLSTKYYTVQAIVTPSLDASKTTPITNPIENDISPSSNICTKKILMSNTTSKDKPMNNLKKYEIISSTSSEDVFNESTHSKNDTINKTKSLKLVKVGKQVTKPPLTQDRNDSSINLPTASYNALENSQSCGSALSTKSSEMTKPCSSVFNKGTNEMLISNATSKDKHLNNSKDDEIKSSTSSKDVANETTNSKHDTRNKSNSNSIANKTKSSKPVTAVQKVIKPPSTQDEKDSSSNLPTTISNTLASSLSSCSALVTKSSEITKSCSSGVSKVITKIQSGSPTLSPTGKGSKTTTSEKQDIRESSSRTNKNITCSTVPSSAEKIKISQHLTHNKMSKLDFTNIVLLADERDNVLRDLSFPNLTWIMKNDMNSVTAFNYIKEHFKSKKYKEKTLYVVICGFKSLYTTTNHGKCDQYNCKYPIKYWELTSKNAKVASDILIDHSKILMEKVQRVSNKKDTLVFSGIVPICLRSIFLANVMKHSKWSPYHQVPVDDSLLHQLDISGWKAVIIYNEWANMVTSKLKLQWNIEEEFFSSLSNRKHFLKGKTLDRDGYDLLDSALNLRREQLSKALKRCFTSMEIGNYSDMQKLKNNESKKMCKDPSKLIKENSNTLNETKRDEIKSKSKVNKEAKIVCEVTENENYVLDTEGVKRKHNRDILKEAAVNYVHIVLVCDERDENLQNLMLNSGTEILFKKDIGIHNAFTEMKAHHLFGKKTLFIMMCGIQTACTINRPINGSNQVQIFGENPEDITKQLIVQAKRLQDKVLKTSGGFDNVIFTGIIPVEYRSMSGMAKRSLLIACLKYNEWTKSQANEMKCNHWDAVVKYWFMLSNDADNGFKLKLKEDIIVQDRLSFTNPAKMYRKNATMEAVAKTWELFKSQDIVQKPENKELRIMLNKKKLNDIERSPKEDDLRIMLNRNKDQTEDPISSNITTKTNDLQVSELGKIVQTSNIPFEKVVIVGNVYYKSLLKTLARDIPKVEILAFTDYSFQQDSAALIKYIENHKYIGKHNTLWVLTANISCITNRQNHSSCEYYRCGDPISFLNTDRRWFIDGEEEARISMRKEAERIASFGKISRDKISELFDGSCAVVLCPPMPATVYVSPYPQTVTYDHQQLHSFLSVFLGTEIIVNDVDVIEQEFLEPLKQFYSDFSMEWLNHACDVLQEEKMCYSNLVEYKGIQGNCIRVLSESMSDKPYLTWIKIMSDIINIALTKPLTRKTPPIESVIITANVSVPLEVINDKQNDIPVVSHPELPSSLEEMDIQQEEIGCFKSIILIGSKKLSVVLIEDVKDNIKFIVGKLNFDEKSDEFILYQQNNFEGPTLWICLADISGLTFTVNSGLCDRHCNQPQRISKFKENENDIVKAEHFVSRMIPKLKKGSAIILAPLAPSQVVLESYFKHHSHLHSFCSKSLVPIIFGDKENLMKNFNEYEKKWLVMIRNICSFQKIVEGYENALDEYVNNYKDPLIDIIESQYKKHESLDEWKLFMEALIQYFKTLKVDKCGKEMSDESLNHSGQMENKLGSSIHETISESDLPNKTNAVTVLTNSLPIPDTSDERKNVSRDATCIPALYEEEIMSEKYSDSNLAEALTNKIVEQDKEIETSKIFESKKGEKGMGIQSIENTNKAILTKTKDLKCTEVGLSKDSKLITKVLSQDSDSISLLGENIVSEKTLTDIPSISEEFNAETVPGEFITSTSIEKESEMHHSIHDIKNKGKSKNRLDILKILSKTRSKKLCAESSKKDHKEHEISDESKPVSIHSQDSSVVETTDTLTRKVCLSKIPESLKDEVIVDLIKTCGPILSFKRNIDGGPTEALCGDSTTAARVARLFNQRIVKGKTVHAWLLKDGSSDKESLPNLIDIEESLEDKETIKKIKDILNQNIFSAPPLFKPRSLSVSGSTSTAIEKNMSSSGLVNSVHVSSSKDAVFGDVDNGVSNSIIINEDIINSEIKKVGNSTNKSDNSEKSIENKKDSRSINKDNNKITDIEVAINSASATSEDISLLNLKLQDKVKRNKISSTDNYKKKEEANTSVTVNLDISSNKDLKKELLHLNKRPEKRKRNSSENQINRTCINQQITAENSKEKSKSLLHVLEVNDCKRRSKSRSQSPNKRRRRKSSETQSKEVTNPYSAESSILESHTSLSPNNVGYALACSSSLTTELTEADFEDDPIVNGLPDGFRLRLDDVQWKEFVNKLKTQFNRHRIEYDEYHQDPEMHDEYEPKKHSFMSMLEKQKPNALQNEKSNLWNQFWIVELKKSDEEKWNQWKNRLIKLTLKKARNNVNTSLVENNPSPFNNCSNNDSLKNMSSNANASIDLDTTVQIKKEPMEIVDKRKKYLKEENMDPLENIASRIKEESNIKIENNKEINTTIKKEPSVNTDMSIPLSFGSENENQLDPEALNFLNDLDKLETEYAPVSEQEMNGPSRNSKRLMNREFHDDPSTSSGRIRSPEFSFGDPQNFNVKKERNINDDHPTIEKRFGDSKGASFLNFNTGQGMIRTESIPNHQTDNPTIESSVVDINQEEGRSETFQEVFKVKVALNTIQRLSTRLSLLGPPLNKCIERIQIQSADSEKELLHLQDKTFLLLLAAAADAFEKKITRINDDVEKSLLEVARTQALGLIEYAKTKQRNCIHGVNIEQIAQRTLSKPSNECRQFIEDAIMYETNSSVKPSEDIVKEIFSEVAMLHYKIIKDSEANK